MPANANDTKRLDWKVTDHLVNNKIVTLAELRAGELGYVLEVESKFSVEEKAACSCFNREGRLERLQPGFTPTSRSGHTGETETLNKGTNQWQ